MTSAMTDAVMLFRPRLQYTSTGESQFDAMITWRADLELGYLDEHGNAEWDAPDVVGGHAEFVVINVGQHPIAELLDSLSQDTALFGVLFEGDDVAEAVQEQFENETFNRVLIVTAIEVAEPLRGNGLGAWVVAELVERMASPTDTIVLLHPAPAEPPASKDAELAAKRALSMYWQQFGLKPIKHQPEFLGAATAYGQLQRARDALRALDEVVFPVPRSLIGVERPAQPRHTLVAEVPEPVGLRLVRD
ncbi:MULTISPECIES: hypothetical protein [unclassified Mycolicibacterium]|uniref:hypothetical protein n=1 Tax=unclassified Mycolicibacterium TaxID=2636767 RepID=UPI001BB3F33F|nr:MULTISPECIES: hypothetical protein [unclassified Mycolicibacterium]